MIIHSFLIRRNQVVDDRVESYVLVLQLVHHFSDFNLLFLKFFVEVDLEVLVIKMEVAMFAVDWSKGAAFFVLIQRIQRNPLIAIGAASYIVGLLEVVDDVGLIEVLPAHKTLFTLCA